MANLAALRRALAPALHGDQPRVEIDVSPLQVQKLVDADHRADGERVLVERVGRQL